MVLVALTGWGQEEDRRQSKDTGFDAHLVKPVDYTALTTLLVSLPSEGRPAHRALKLIQATLESKKNGSKLFLLPNLIPPNMR
jgi:CheY-like chemotaxis protein